MNSRLKKEEPITKKGKKGKKINEKEERLSYVLMDACHMTFEDCSFDLVIDKVLILSPPVVPMY